MSLICNSSPHSVKREGVMFLSCMHIILCVLMFIQSTERCLGTVEFCIGVSKMGSVQSKYIAGLP